MAGWRWNTIKWTVVIEMASGEHHVGITSDPLKYLQEKKRQTKNGYFAQKRNKGGARILYAFKGDYKVKLKAFGCKKFVEMMGNEDPVVEVMINIVG